MNLAHNPGPCISFVAAADTALGLRVTINSSGQAAIAGIAARGIGHADSGIDSGVSGPIRLTNTGGELVGIASEAIAVGDTVLTAASGKCSKTTGGGALEIGICTFAAGTNGDQFKYIPCRPVTA
ncbi:MAG TPA: DUF2190 family protein [Pseudomonadota bacterium]|nr:DUF2190 family protein [Pseudomonadota bacterium]